MKKGNIMIRSVPSTGMDLAAATAMVTRHGSGDLLVGLDRIASIWDDYCRNGDDRYEWDDEFIDDYNYEFDAYNIVFENMSKLFARKAA
jgi:hypothetical protein